VSAEVAERARDLGAGNVEVIPHGVDTSLFRPTDDTPARDTPYFVYTGTMSDLLGAGVFVRAMPIVLDKHPKARLRFFGQGNEEPMLRELAAELAPDAVEFGGVVPPAQVRRWISGAVGALASVVPGRGYDFAIATKIYAAAACGTPSVFAGVGASAALVEGNKLGLVAEYTPEAVAAQMIAMLDGERPDGERLVTWIHDNASMANNGRRAAAWITEDVRRVRL